LAQTLPHTAKRLPHCPVIVSSIKTTFQKGTGMKKERRWMKSAIAASTETQIILPWTRGQRRRPEAMKPAAAPKGQANALR
jgi:hypothetical protein